MLCSYIVFSMFSYIVFSMFSYIVFSMFSYIVFSMFSYIVFSMFSYIVCSFIFVTHCYFCGVIYRLLDEIFSESMLVHKRHNFIHLLTYTGIAGTGWNGCAIALPDLTLAKSAPCFVL